MKYYVLLRARDDVTSDMYGTNTQIVQRRTASPEIVRTGEGRVSVNEVTTRSTSHVRVLGGPYISLFRKTSITLNGSPWRPLTPPWARQHRRTCSEKPQIHGLRDAGLH